ncbi:MAG TPA: hypothetical protein VK806_07785 [Bacteroidia bacterium]|jgi:hypothetical protein|nr:hypothetical protein [Bacteroidia bacterium]
MKLKVFACIISMVLLCSCATYYITPQMLRNHNGSFSSITTLKCVDKDGKDYVMDITAQTEIRITKKDDTHETFYFVTGFLQDSIITGSKSYFLNIMVKPIKISDIKKIELQSH